ncbi:MAG: Uma2 family endonuclease [Bacteroidota bacterium]
MEAKKLDNVSLEAYIAIEDQSDSKYEYHDGVIVAMAGGTVEHGLISANVLGELAISLRSKNNSCRPITSDVKVYIDISNKYLYPDGMVVCGGLERTQKEVGAITNPSVIIEVLSKSTEGYDRGNKFFFYKQIPTLTEYLLIDQYHPQIDLYWKVDGQWHITRAEGLENSLTIPSLDLALPLKDIYRDVFS